MEDARESLDEADASLPKRGDIVAGKYRIERVVGEGASGQVYAAHHLALDRGVALKVLFADPAEDPTVIDRFLREARTAAKIESVNVTRVLDTGELPNGRPFLVMELLVGGDLTSTLALHGPLPIPRAVEYILQALEGVAVAHALGIVHRDLKPANLFLAMREDDGTEIVKILDFGISKTPRTSRAGSSGSRAEMTKGSRDLVGSPSYMSPEQLRNASAIDKRADLWSLAVVLYELLTDALPFDGDGVGELLAKILEGEPASLRKRRPEVPEELEQAIFKGFAKHVDDRYQNASEMAAAIAPFAGEEHAHVPHRIAGYEQRTGSHSVGHLKLITPHSAMKMPLPSSTKRVLAAARAQSASEERVRVDREKRERSAKGEKARSKRGLVVGVVVSVAAAAVVVGLIALVARPGPIAVPKVGAQSKSAAASGSAAADNVDTPDIELNEEEGKSAPASGGTRPPRRRAPKAPVDRPDFLRKSE
jgi:serine/threonine-protein kinase